MAHRWIYRNRSFFLLFNIKNWLTDSSGIRDLCWNRRRSALPNGSARFLGEVLLCQLEVRNIFQRELIEF